MRIQHNIMAMSAYRNYTNNVSAMKKNLEKLSSGYKINRAGDDAAGLAISEKMRAQITGLETAQKNAKDGISLIQTAEGALTEVHDMLNRMVELATQSANGTYDNETDRYQLQKEVDQLRSEINRIADSANFNGIKLLDGSLSTQNGGGITDIKMTDYQKASSADGAITVDFVRERPAAATDVASEASFEVSLDELGLTGVGATATSVKVTLSINGVEIGTASIASVPASGIDASAVVSALLSGVKGFAASSVNGIGKASATASGSGAAVLIDGHMWKVTASGGKVKFEQADADFMKDGDAAVIPDKYGVTLQVTGEKVTYKAPNVNEFVQNTKYYDPSGAGLQARTEMTIDFSKLKDGDTIKVGSTTYAFKVTENGASTVSGATMIDLSKLDLTKTAGQQKALANIVEAMASNTEWSAGNAGAKGGKGTITFQSISSTAGGTASAAALDSEAKVMNRFVFTSKESAATASFRVDPTKIKEGDTFTVNGVTYEFSKNSNVSQSGNIAINLGDNFTEDGVKKSAASVANAIKAAIEKDTYTGGAEKKYDVQADVDGTVTLTAKDNSKTTTVDEIKNSIKVVGGGGLGLTLQIGDTAEKFNQLNVSVEDCHTTSLGIDSISVANQADAQAAIDKIKSAINYVSDVRGTLGATQNRLDHTINNLGVMTENIQDAESTIRDVDVAEEMMAYTKNNILIQSAQAMLAQANQVPQGVLQLLQ